MADPPLSPPKPNLTFLVTSLASRNPSPVMIPDGNPYTPNGKANVSEKSSSEGVKQKKLLSVILKPYMLTSRQIRLSRPFARENGMKKAEEIILVDKHGVKWPFQGYTNQQDFYIVIGWISFCAANELEIGDAFTLMFSRGEDTTPILKFCSTAKLEHEEEGQEENECRVQKRARVYAEGEPSCSTRSSNESRVDPKNLQPKQPCSISDQLTKVKLSILDVLNGIRLFRTELETKEINLQALLQKIDAPGGESVVNGKDP